MCFSSRETTQLGLASVIPSVDSPKSSVAERDWNAQGWLRGRSAEAFMTCGGKATAHCGARREMSYSEKFCSPRPPSKPKRSPIPAQSSPKVRN